MLIRNTPSTEKVDLLILGAGWTSTFLIPLLLERNISYAATTTTGRENTIKFKFDPESKDNESNYKTLPPAHNIVITFPLKGADQTSTLLNLYQQTHPTINSKWILLGSAGIWQIPNQETWVSRGSRYDTSNERAQAEDQLLKGGGCVLSLSGLWGGARQPRDWIERVAPTKDQLSAKTSLHMIHGQDVSRAIIAVLGDGFTPGERWMLTDMFVYDWWALALGWGNGGKAGSGYDNGNEDGDKDAAGPHAVWVRELMVEQGVRALPRDAEALGRCYDSREFWERCGIAPVRARI